MFPGTLYDDLPPSPMCQDFMTRDVASALLRHVIARWKPDFQGSRSFDRL